MGTAGWIDDNIEYTWSSTIIDSTHLVRFLYGVHGYQIFELGAFNADPHPGNIMIDQNSDTVSLIDYGQLTQISASERIIFAQFIIAVDNLDAEGVAEVWKAWGASLVSKLTGALNDPTLILAYSCLHYGGRRHFK